MIDLGALGIPPHTPSSDNHESLTPHVHLLSVLLFRCRCLCCLYEPMSGLLEVSWTCALWVGPALCCIVCHTSRCSDAVHVERPDATSIWEEPESYLKGTVHVATDRILKQMWLKHRTLLCIGSFYPAVKSN